MLIKVVFTVFAIFQLKKYVDADHKFYPMNLQHLSPKKNNFQ